MVVQAPLLNGAAFYNDGGDLSFSFTPSAIARNMLWQLTPNAQATATSIRTTAYKNTVSRPSSARATKSMGDEKGGTLRQRN